MVYFYEIFTKIFMKATYQHVVGSVKVPLNQRSSLVPATRTSTTRAAGADGTVSHVGPIVSLALRVRQDALEYIAEGLVGCDSRTCKQMKCLKGDAVW